MKRTIQAAVAAICLAAGLNGCASFEGQVGLPLATGKSSAANGGASGSALFSANMTASIAPAARLPETVENTAIMQQFRSMTTAPHTGGMNLMSTAADAALQVGDRRMEFTVDDLKQFLIAHDRDVLRPLLSGSERPVISTAAAAVATDSPAGHAPTQIEIYRAYLTAYFIGRYVDRGGHKYGAPDIKTGLSNEVLSQILQIFFDATVDAGAAARVLVSSDAKKFYPAGGADKPTLLVVFDRKKFDCGARCIKVEDDPADGSPAPKGKMTVAKAKAVGAIAQIAEKKTALLSGMLGELFGGVDVGFVLGGRFAVGDNKTLVEMAKRVLAAASHHYAEEKAYAFLLNHSFDPDSDLGFLLQFILQLETEAKKKQA
ncbi:MAG: hypothetical protein FJX35_26000 [Alphaproteobacteria bacterium]|nr:hypothetical protein [Alphaproteobacteria bacterium]